MSMAGAGPATVAAVVAAQRTPARELIRLVAADGAHPEHDHDHVPVAVSMDQLLCHVIEMLVPLMCSGSHTSGEVPRLLGVQRSPA